MWITDPEAQTPIERLGAYWAKRDDLFLCDGARGGKCRAAFKIATKAELGVVTYGSRTSPQGSYTSRAARAAGRPCVYVTPHGAETAEIAYVAATGAEVVRCRPGYLSQCASRARVLAKEWGYEFVQLSMESPLAVASTRAQVPAVLPRGVRRIVIVVGGGVSAAAVLHGLRDHGHTTPVLGVQIGRDPLKIINRWAPMGWQDQMTIVKAEQDYNTPSPNEWEGLVVDPYYEAKCLPFLEPGDLFWIVGIRPGADPAEAGWEPKWQDPKALRHELKHNQFSEE